MDDKFVTPIIAGAFVLITSAVAGIIAKRSSKANAREDRAPDVTDSWREADRARTAYYALLPMFYDLRSAFRSFVQRVANNGSKELTPSELKAFELEPPSLDPKEK